MSEKPEKVERCPYCDRRVRRMAGGELPCFRCGIDDTLDGEECSRWESDERNRSDADEWP